MNIVFLACNRHAGRFREDPSWRYRCESLALALQEAGHSVICQHIQTWHGSGRPQVVVFHRPRWSMRLVVLLRWLRWRGVVVLADFDDLVFDPSYAAYSPGVLNQLVSLEKTQQHYRAHQRALALFSLVSVSTAPLAAYGQQLFPASRFILLVNTVHSRWRRVFDKQAVPEPNWAQPIISYLPGTRSHDRDFQTIAPALTQFLQDHPTVRLHITGPLSFNLPAVSHQIQHYPKVAFESFHQQLQPAWVNLAPLEDSPFTRCKSALKVLEAAYWGKPTICSTLPDAQRFVGAGAFIAESPTAVNLHLHKLLNPRYYQSVTVGLRERAVALADVDTVARQFLAAVQPLVPPA